MCAHKTQRTQKLTMKKGKKKTSFKIWVFRDQLKRKNKGNSSINSLFLRTIKQFIFGTAGSFCYKFLVHLRTFTSQLLDLHLLARKNPNKPTMIIKSFLMLSNQVLSLTSSSSFSKLTSQKERKNQLTNSQKSPVTTSAWISYGIWFLSFLCNWFNYIGTDSTCSILSKLWDSKKDFQATTDRR